jgi:hypothetical protein
MTVPTAWKYKSIHRRVEDLADQLFATPPGGTAFYVWGPYGDDDASGLSPGHALASVEAALDKCTAEKHDVVYLIASDTADSPTASIAWSKDHTHLIGLGADFPGIGQRSRITGAAATAIGVEGVLAVSARGCIIKNLQVQNATAAASGGVLVSGPYNYFENVFFNGMNDASSANKATSYCLSVTAAENVFRHCTIGSVQTVGTAGFPLLISTGAELFEDCLIQRYSQTTGAFLVQLVAGTAGMSLLRFNDCTFYCQTVNWAAGITDVFNVAQTGSHYVLLKDCVAIGGTGAGISWSDVVTHVYHNQAAPATGGGIAIAVNA